MVISRNSIKMISIILSLFMIVWAAIGLGNKYGIVSKPSPAAEQVTVSGPNIEDMWTATGAIDDSEGLLSEYRLERARVRSKEMSLLQQIASNVDSPTLAKEAAYSKLVNLVDREEKELQAEALVKAQGISDCAVVISDTTTMVIVSGSGTNAGGQDSIRKSVGAAVGITDKAISVVQISQ